MSNQPIVHRHAHVPALLRRTHGNDVRYAHNGTPVTEQQAYHVVQKATQSMQTNESFRGVHGNWVVDPNTMPHGNVWGDDENTRDMYSGR